VRKPYGRSYKWDPQSKQAILCNYDLPSGATVVVLLCAIFLLSRSTHWLIHHSKAGQNH